MIDVSIDATMGVVQHVPDLWPETPLSSELRFSPAEVIIFIVLTDERNLFRRCHLEVSVCISITALFSHGYDVAPYDGG